MSPGFVTFRSWYGALQQIVSAILVICHDLWLRIFCHSVVFQQFGRMSDSWREFGFTVITRCVKLLTLIIRFMTLRCAYEQTGRMLIHQCTIRFSLSSVVMNSYDKSSLFHVFLYVPSASPLLLGCCSVLYYPYLSLLFCMTPHHANSFHLTGNQLLSNRLFRHMSYSRL